MPRYIIKPVRDDDFYVEYSTIVDAPVDWGSRSYFVERLGAQVNERLDRADRNGTSTQWEGFTDEEQPDNYTIDEIMIVEGFRWELVPEDKTAYVRRENLRKFLEDTGDGFFNHNHPAVLWVSHDE